MIALYMSFSNGSALTYFSSELSRLKGIRDSLDLLRQVDAEGASWTVSEIMPDGTAPDITEEVRPLYES